MGWGSCTRHDDDGSHWLEGTYVAKLLHLPGNLQVLLMYTSLLECPAKVLLATPVFQQPGTTNASRHLLTTQALPPHVTYNELLMLLRLYADCGVVDGSGFIPSCLHRPA